MKKFGLYTKNTGESAGYVNTIDMPSVGQAEAYFAGRKQLTLEQFRSIYTVKEMTDNSKNLLFG